LGAILHRKELVDSAYGRFVPRRDTSLEALIEQCCVVFCRRFDRVNPRLWSDDGQTGCAVKALVHSGGIPARELVRSTR
jgi:hypothetical protein